MRWSVAVRTLAVLTLLGSVVPSVAVAATPPGARWDPGIEWRMYPRQMNPSPDLYGNPDVWAYMGSQSQAHDPSTYYLLPHYEATYAGAAQVWEDYANPNAGWLHVSRVRTTRHGYFPGEFSPANGMHPGPAGQMSIIAWTSPISGSVRIEGYVNQVGGLGCPEGSGVTWWVDQGTTTLFMADLPLAGETSFDLSPTVAAGDVIYFILDAGENDMCDTTFVNLDITAVK